MVRLDSSEVFLNGWLVDPEGLVTEAFVRVGQCVSENLLAIAARYPCPNLIASTPGADRCGTLPGLAARLLVLGHNLPPSVDARPLPPNQAELVLVMRGGSVQVERVRLSPPQALLGRDPALFRLATRSAARHTAQARKARRGPLRAALHAALRAFVALIHLLWRPFSGIKPVRRIKDLVPAQHLLTLNRKRREWLAIGPDPVFRCSNALPPGTYMLEVEMILSRARTRSRVYFDFGHGESESRSAPLWVRNCRLTKRLLFLPERSRVRFDPTDFPGKVTLRHFRLVRVSWSFAISRMRRKLAAAGVVKHPDELRIAELWERYSNLFSAESHVSPTYEGYSLALASTYAPAAHRRQGSRSTKP